MSRFITLLAVVFLGVLPGALRASEVRVWGGASTPASVLAVPAGLTDAVQIVAGTKYIAVLRATGAVQVWGEDLNPGDNILTVPTLAQSGIVEIAGGPGQIVARRTDGTVVAWGDNGFEELDVNSWTGITHVAAGAGVSLGLTATGEVKVAGNQSPAVITGSGYIEMQGGVESVLLRNASGLVSLQSVPGFVSFTPPAGLIASSLAPTRFLALEGDLAIRAADNVVVGWGAFDEGNVLTTIPAGLTATQVEVGGYHAAALRVDGSIAIWGIQRLPTETVVDAGYAVPEGYGGAEKITCGAYCTAAIFTQAPIALSLSAKTVSELAPTGTEVGVLSATSQTSGETFSYSLVPGFGSTDNAFFSISGTSLQVTGGLDYETKPNLSIRVRATQTAPVTTTTDVVYIIQVLNNTADDPRADSDSSFCGLGAGGGISIFLLALLGLRFRRAPSKLP